MKYIARLKAVAEGGTVKTEGNSLRVAGANSVTLFLTAGTDHILNPPYRGNPHEKVTAGQLAAAAAKPYDELRKAHIADYQKLFRRASLDLGGHEARKLPTDQRVARMAKDKTPDPDLEALLFQFGRYLAISSSRPGNLLSSLQGVWADGIQTPWCDQYTVDLNVQMNCWPLEIANLSECFLPAFDLIDSWRVPGAKTAKCITTPKVGSCIPSPMYGASPPRPSIPPSGCIWGWVPGSASRCGSTTHSPATASISNAPTP